MMEPPTGNGMEPRPPPKRPGGLVSRASTAMSSMGGRTPRGVGLIQGEGGKQPKQVRASQRKLEDELNFLQMEELKDIFQAADVDGNGALDLEEFIGEMGRKLGGPRASREGLTLLFRRMDANMDNVVEWNEFSDFMLLEGLANDKREAANATYICQDRIARPENKQHTGLTRRIMFSPELGKYFTCATDATIRVWSRSLQHMKTVNVTVDHRTVDQKTVVSSGGWVNDFCLWPAGGQLAAATTRAISVYDINSMEKIDELPRSSATLCMDCWTTRDGSFTTKDRVAGVTLYAFGDDQGNVSVMRPPSTLHGHKNPCEILWSAKEHEDWVTKVQYIADLKCIATSSNDCSLHMLEEDLGEEGRWEPKRDPYTGEVIKIGAEAHVKGIRSFVWSKGYKCFATCGIERFIFLWNPYGKQVGMLGPNSASVQDMAVNDSRNQLITITADDVCKVWDLTNTKCTQSIDCMYIPESLISNRNRRVTQNHKHPTLAAGQDVKEGKVLCLHMDSATGCITLGTPAMSVWQMKAAIVAEQERSHLSEVSLAVFNLQMRQVISCDISSHVCVWDFDSGDMSYTLDNAHGDSKVSAMTVDSNGACLLTGGNDGCVRMWNLSNGKYVKQFMKSTPGEVTQLLYYTQGGFSFVVGVGWDRTVTVWADDHVFTESAGQIHVGRIKPLYTLPGHTDDIHCVAATDKLLATGADNGEIRVWNLETTSYRHSLVDFTPLPNTPAGKGGDSRGESIEQVVIERLVFLKASGVLVSCSGDGYIRFWEAADNKLIHRESARHHPSDPILALDASSDGNRLLTADAAGYIKVWDVSAFNAYSGRAMRASPSAASAGLGGFGSSPKLQLKCTLHFGAHRGAVNDARFLELAEYGPYMGRPDAPEEKKKRLLAKRRMSSVGVGNSGGYILTASADGDVCLWLANTGAEVGNFKKGQHWNLNNPNTFKSRVCAAAVNDMIVAENAKMKARFDYPTSTKSVESFLPGQDDDDGRWKNSSQASIGSGSTAWRGSSRVGSQSGKRGKRLGKHLGGGMVAIDPNPQPTEQTSTWGNGGSGGKQQQQQQQQQQQLQRRQLQSPRGGAPTQRRIQIQDSKVSLASASDAASTLSQRVIRRSSRDEVGAPASSLPQVKAPSGAHGHLGPVMSMGSMGSMASMGSTYSGGSTFSRWGLATSENSGRGLRPFTAGMVLGVQTARTGNKSAVSPKVPKKERSFLGRVGNGPPLRGRDGELLRLSLSGSQSARGPMTTSNALLDGPKGGGSSSSGGGDNGAGFDRFLSQVPGSPSLAPLGAQQRPLTSNQALVSRGTLPPPAAKLSSFWQRGEIETRKRPGALRDGLQHGSRYKRLPLAEMMPRDEIEKKEFTFLDRDRHRGGKFGMA